MKSKKTVSYFPVSMNEQALLLRVRESDLAGRLEELVDMLDLIADANLSKADLEQAIQSFQANSQGEGLDARFDNLEGRLKERITKGLAEIEGRLSKRLAGVGGAVEDMPPEPPEDPPGKGESPPSDDDDVPKEASVAFRIGSELVWGVSAAQFYLAVWRWLFEHGRVKPTELPIQSGKKRYVVAAAPIHPSGKEFTRSEEPVPGVFVEANLSRGDIIKRAKKYLDQYGVAFDVVVGGEG
jgi:hypothetical protein